MIHDFRLYNEFFLKEVKALFDSVLKCFANLS